jgi:hypothetical protein
VSPRRTAVGIAVLLVALGSASCSGDENSSTGQVPTVPGISVLPDDPSMPYGIVAIDYHFHDAHPSASIAPDRTVTWRNDGSVVHNVTFAQIGFSRDFAPGESFEIRRLGDKLGGPGTYTFFCRFHDNLGMRGTIIIA